TALHKYFLAQQLTHIAAHTQSRLPQSPHHAADSKTSARNNRTSDPRHHQTTHARVSDESDSTQPGARRAHFQTCAQFPSATQVQPSIQTHQTLQTTSASQHKHRAKAFPHSPSHAQADRNHALS